MLLNKDGEPKLFKQFGRFSLIFLFLASLLSAESFKDFKRVQNQAFAEYKDTRDKIFYKNLQKQFEEYKAHYTPPLYKNPKPKSIIAADKKKIKSVGPTLSIKMKPVVQSEIQKATIALVPSLKYNIIFGFFGTDLGFNIDENIKKVSFYPVNQEGISRFFNGVAKSEYEDIVASLLKIQKTMNLNDWGVYLLVRELSKKIFSNLNESKLFSWFLFNKLGYDVRVGIAQKEITLMHYSKKTLYSTPSYTFENKKFYVFSRYNKGKIGRLYSYEKSYPEATKAFDLSLKELPKFNLSVKKRSLYFKVDAMDFHTTYTYNQNLIDFMATYPQADYETFFNAPIDAMTYTTIARDLKKHIDGMKASEAINFVLSFVQNAFVYERDKQQFGREKVMFAQETLFFERSDCEDRAVLFAYLIKELFGYSVIGVKYADHMATALYIPLEGDSVRVGKKTYVIADPTYINASVGQSMPKYKLIRPESFIYVKRRDK